MRNIRLSILVFLLTGWVAASTMSAERLNEVRFLGQTSDTLPPIRLEQAQSRLGGIRSPKAATNGSEILQTNFENALKSCSTTENRSFEAVYENSTSSSWSSQPWSWQLFPSGMIYQQYLAGVNEARMSGVWNSDKDVDWIWDITLGGKAPILRYGNRSALYPEGFQFDIEGAAHLRLDMEHERDMDATDYHFGIPVSYGNRIWQVRFGYHHVSSHLGDERMIRLMEAGIDHGRINFVRESLILGYSYRLRPSIRLYAEADYAFWTDFSRPWHFQFGAEYSSPYPSNGFMGKPFAAVNVQLLQEHDFDGNICVQAGWQWRGSRNQLFRVGLQYFGGVSEQYEHIAKREHKIGFGLWYDF